jgi:mono/diheme cytochrome c family protein
MRRLAIRIVAIVCLAGLISCAMKSFVPPPVTAELAPASSGQYPNIAMLREGRALFVHRCIECHTLPPFWHYRTEDWPKIVDSMSRRANLKPSQRDAVVTYILAVRAQ